MDCPHLTSAVQLSVEWLAQKCAEVLSSAASAPAADASSASPASPSAARNQWKCLECQSDAENWLCLYCGAVLCGRYVNKHAMQHSHRADNADHSVCLNTLSRAVYCYSCDEFVINDTPGGRLGALRGVFPADLDDEEEEEEHQHACDDEECEARAECKASAAANVDLTTVHSDASTALVTAPKSQPLQTQQQEKAQQHPHHSPKKGRRITSDTVAVTAAAKTLHETRSTSSSDSGLGVEEFPATPQPIITASAVSSSLSAAGGLTQASPTNAKTPTASSNGGRKLRPRKRTASAESTSDASSNTSGTPPTSRTAAATAATRATPTTAPAAKRKLLRKVVGLRNLGNTCFMNSVLQSLSNIQEFSCYFNALPSLDPNGGGAGGGGSKPKRVYHSRSLKENHSAADANVVEELRKILTNLSHGGDGSKAISPECLFLVIWKVVPQFRGHRQHDAHEFLRYMLDRLHTELQHVPVPSTTGTTTTASATGAGTTEETDASVAASGSGKLQLGPATSGLEAGSIMFKGRSSIVTSVFGGTLQSEVRCLICGMESKKHDPFLDLSLDIPEKFYKESPAATTEDGQTKPPSCHIADCLSSFTEIEELAETELYYCSACKCKQKSTKRFWIRRLPNVLCLHIKRFRWNNFFRTKIDLRITFPITSMDMSQFVLNNNGPETRRSAAATNVYDLAAVIVHHGNGSSCGHYTSYAINNGTWLHFNDHTVKEVHPSAVEECKPYILFYIRRDPNASKS